MIANIFLHPDTFVYNNSDTKDHVAEKLGALVDDMSRVVYEFSHENKFKVPISLTTVEVFPGYDIFSFAEECLNNDEKGVFYSMMGNTSETFDNITLEELRDKCRYQVDETEVNSILFFNVPNEDLLEEDRTEQSDEEKKKHKSIINDYIEFDRYEVVYNQKTWFYLRRQILGNHPGDPEFFISECRKYFPMLSFHNNCISSLIDSNYNYLETSPRKLVYYLSCLNDCFCKFQKTYSDITRDPDIILSDFSGRYGLDEPGSIQQNPEKKPYLTFGFRKNDKSECNVICEFHFKISQQDSNCIVSNIDYSNFHPRIYFYYPDPTIEGGKIPVGSIGKHI